MFRFFLKNKALQYIIIFLGSVLYAFSVALILEPNRLAPGGASGLAIVLSLFIPIGTGTIILLLNIPLIWLGIKSFGIKFLYTTIFAIIVNSAFVNIFALFPPVLNDVFLASICGGVVNAISLGIILRLGGTTGGTDIVAKLLRKKMPHLEIGTLFILVDMVIVVISAFVFGNVENAVYAGICVVITGQILDSILYGGQNARMLVIISDEAERIAGRLLDDLDTGVTYLNGRGGYTQKEKNVIICVVRKRSLPRTTKIVSEEDSRAFMIITSAENIVGEGYGKSEDE